jgi:glyoxylase-like metal-dependent hydrolase (beta-lactamase superfamily II)
MNGVAGLRNFANRTWRSAETAPLLSVRRASGRIGSLEAGSRRSMPLSPREDFVLIAGFPAGSFAANCYVVAPGPGEECLIIDPGQDAEPGISELLAEHRLRPAAVLATHGHIDHVWSVAPVCGARGIPAYIHPADRDLLSDPAKGFPLQVGQQLFRGLTFTEPDDVIALEDGMTLQLAGVELVVDHAPGHTQGSVTFRSAEQVMFSGDVLFAGSIGRTDLPGGDYPAMLDTLSRVCLTLPDDTLVLPGHGAQTTIGAERATNPFLAGLSPRPEPPAGPGSKPPAPATGPKRPGL